MRRDELRHLMPNHCDGLYRLVPLSIGSNPTRHARPYLIKPRPSDESHRTDSYATLRPNTESILFNAGPFLTSPCDGPVPLWPPPRDELLYPTPNLICSV